MSTLIRDPFRGDNPSPMRASSAAGLGALPLAARWPVAAPPRLWPPYPEVESTPLPDPIASHSFDDDDIGAWAAFQPAPRQAPTRAPRPTEAEPDAQPVAALDWAVIEPAPPSTRTARDPSPSRLTYRLHRLWLTPTVRHFLRLGLPLLLVSALIGNWFASTDHRDALAATVDGWRQSFENQPMFQVASLDVQSRSPEVAQAVAQRLGVSFPVSSFDLDLAELRRTAEAFDAVERAWLQVRSDGVLEVRIAERMPAMVWRNAEGLDLVDTNGFRVARLATRSARADLPLIAGEGAPAAIAEARLLWAAALPLQPRLRGLVRIGARRWDLVLDRDQRIQLPEHGALGALERVVGLDTAQQVLSRDVLAVDMRNPARPTLRLTPDAMGELNRNRRLQGGIASR